MKNILNTKIKIGVMSIIIIIENIIMFFIHMPLEKMFPWTNTMNNIRLHSPAIDFALILFVGITFVISLIYSKKLYDKKISWIIYTIIMTTLAYFTLSANIQIVHF